jgi:transposase
MDQFPFPACAVDAEVVMNTPWPMLGYVQQLTEEIEALKARIELLESKLNRNSSNSNQPPSNDSPFKPKSDLRQDKKKSVPKRKGARQQCLRPSEVRELFPGRCACGCEALRDPEPYYIHQFVELPTLQLDVEHLILYRGHCAGCGKLRKALILPDRRVGFGPRLSALVAELCGVHGDSRRAIQDFLFSVLRLPVSQGGIQKILDRMAVAIAPHYAAIDAAAHASSMNHVDETSWRRRGKLAWLWVLTNAGVALFMIHSRRSRAAFRALIKDWQGILVSDGYGVYRNWVGLRQACLAHLIREAKGLSERGDKELARCGFWAWKELRRLCHMAKAPPTQGEWSMFYARFIRLLTTYEHRQDEAGKFARRLRSEMDHLWLFLQEKGVSPTNNHAERMLRFAVLWRKRSLGTNSENGERWAERILSLRHSCRLQRKRTFPVLIDAMQAYVGGGHPDLEWIHRAAA